MKNLKKSTKIGLGTLVAGILGVLAFAVMAIDQLRFSLVDPKITPNTPSYNAYCLYPAEIYIDSSGYKVMATDSKFFYSGFLLTGFQTGGAFANYVSSVGTYWRPLTGTSLRSQGIYQTGKAYFYINANVGFGGTGLTISGGLLSKQFFKNTADINSGEFVFYFVTGTGDDSNIQSGVVNGFMNVVSSTSGAIIALAKRPCILDIDTPRFTGYYSGSQLDAFSGAFEFTVYDWTGLVNVPHYYNSAIINPTNHYYFSGTEYVPVGSHAIDNQMGINSGCVLFSMSGITHLGFTGEGVFSGTPLIPLSGTTWTGRYSFATGYNGEGSGRTWTGNRRGYSLYVDLFADNNWFGGIYDNQIVTVTLTGCDYPNQTGNNHTGSVTYSLTITGFDKIPPYLTSAVYTYVANNGTSTLGSDAAVVYTAGGLFSPAQIANWTDWTSGNVQLLLTGSETYKILTGSITGYLATYLPQTLPLLATDTYGVFKTLTYSGNYTGGTFLFIDNPLHQGYGALQDVNTGYTYVTGGTRYVETFKFDVFWIDRAAPLIITGQNSNDPTAGYVRLSLSGLNTGNTASIKDDEFVVLGFSGATTPNFVLTGGYTTGTWSLYHSGILFTNDRYGCVQVRDRAGNTDCYYINIVMDTRDLNVVALPAQRVDNNFAFTGQLLLWNTGTFASMGTGNFATFRYDIPFTSLGTGLFTGVTLPASGNNFMFILKSRAHISAGYTGTNFDRTSTGINFTTGTYGFSTGYFNLFPGVTISSTYPGDRLLIVPGDVNDNDIVGASDLIIVNSGLTVGFNTIDFWNDFDNDGYVTAKDQAILIENSSRKGFWAVFFGLTLVGSPETAATQVNYPWTLH